MKTTLESIIFYYTFSVINTMFVPCTALLYDTTAATQTLKLSTTLLSISCGIRLISFWWCPLLSVDCFHKLCLLVTPSENSQVGWDLGNKMDRGYRFDAKWVCLMGSYVWDIQVFYSRNEVAPEMFPPKEFYKLPVSVEKKSWSFPYFCKSYCQRKIETFLWATLYMVCMCVCLYVHLCMCVCMDSVDGFMV